MISERMLKNWRRDALLNLSRPIFILDDGTNRIEMTREYAESLGKTINTLDNRVLRLTQELMDMHLVRKRDG